MLQQIKPKLTVISNPHYLKAASKKPEKATIDFIKRCKSLEPHEKEMVSNLISSFFNK